jgi:hypothetical protein
MFSGLERERAVLHRERTVAWVWIKARGIMRNRPTPTHSKLTTSVLLTSDCAHHEEAANWRDSLAAITYRNLARQICDQFYDLSILYAWRNRTPEAVAAGRMLSPALPSYCRDRAPAPAGSLRSQRDDKARILEAVLPHPAERRSAVLIALRSRAA